MLDDGGKSLCNSKMWPSEETAYLGQRKTLQTLNNEPALGFAKLKIVGANGPEQFAISVDVVDPLLVKNSSRAAYIDTQQ
jgi:hypothetical protein